MADLCQTRQQLQDYYYNVGSEERPPGRLHIGPAEARSAPHDVDGSVCRQGLEGTRAAFRDSGHTCRVLPRQRAHLPSPSATAGTPTESFRDSGHAYRVLPRQRARLPSPSATVDTPTESCFLFPSLEANRLLLNRSDTAGPDRPLLPGWATPEGALLRPPAAPCPGLPSRAAAVKWGPRIQVFSSQQYLKGFLNIKL